MGKPVHDLSAQVQTDTCGSFVRATVIAGISALKDPRKIFRCYPDTGIFDHQRLSIDDIYELRSDGPTPSECVKEIVSRPGGEVPVAIGANSITTVRVFHVARELGIRIPEELGLCGPEDWDWVSELNWPMLVEPHVTTVKIPATAIGERAADLLIQKLQSGEDETPQEIFLPCEFTARDSTLRTST